MKRIAILAALITTPVFAQTPPSPTPLQPPAQDAPNETEREAGNLLAVLLHVKAQLNSLVTEREALKKQIAELEARLAAAQKPAAPITMPTPKIP